MTGENIELLVRQSGALYDHENMSVRSIVGSWTGTLSRRPHGTGTGIIIIYDRDNFQCSGLKPVWIPPTEYIKLSNRLIDMQACLLPKHVSQQHEELFCDKYWGMEVGKDDRIRHNCIEKEILGPDTLLVQPPVRCDGSKRAKEKGKLRLLREECGWQFHKCKEETFNGGAKPTDIVQILYMPWNRGFGLRVTAKDGLLRRFRALKCFLNSLCPVPRESPGISGQDVQKTDQVRHGFRHARHMPFFTSYHVVSIVEVMHASGGH